VSFWLEQPHPGPLPDRVTSDVESQSPYPLPWLDVQVLQFLLQDYLNLRGHVTLVPTSFQAVILLRDWTTNGLSGPGFRKADRATRLSWRGKSRNILRRRGSRVPNATLWPI